MSEWLTVGQVADVLGVHPAAVRRMVTAGRLPASRLTRAARSPWLINAQLLEQQRREDAERARVYRRMAESLAFSDG